MTGPASLVRLARQPLGAPEGLVVDRHALRDGAEWHALGELVAVARERRVVGDATRERGRECDDRAPAARDGAVGLDRYAVGAVLDPADGGAEHHPLGAELLRHPQRHELGAAHEAILLGAALGVESISRLPAEWM